jgi:hypothetical protein
MNNSIWIILTTILSCVMVGWALDTDGRYLQQATLVIAGLLVGMLLGEGEK